MICHYTEAGIDWNQSRVLFSVKLYISCAEEEGEQKTRSRPD